jgi:MarR family transcriptional regulator for hemolysin
MSDSYDTPERRFGITLVGLARRWRQMLDTRLAITGLTDASWKPLVHLEIQGDGLHQKELASVVGIDESSLVRLIDVLSERGLVERRVDEKDRRARRIFLTSEGRALVSAIREKLTVFEDDVLSSLAPDEIARIVAAFDVIDEKIREINDSMRDRT